MGNRFSRLEELRGLQEEAAGQAFARTLVRIEELTQHMAELDRQTAEEQRAAIEALANPGAGRPDAGLMQSFLAGQAWRRQRLEQMLHRARHDSEQARAAWHEARMRLQQSEKLAEKEGARLKQEAKRQENKELDFVAINRIGRDPAGQYQTRRNLA
ncbi:MAG: flagellar export protein FliJ [Magnetococcales bacterium]|nr:flagellar export protein FliJ [Magnetococcales bacterium]